MSGLLVKNRAGLFGSLLTLAQDKNLVELTLSSIQIATLF